MEGATAPVVVADTLYELRFAYSPARVPQPHDLHEPLNITESMQSVLII